MKRYSEESRSSGGSGGAGGGDDDKRYEGKAKRRRGGSDDEPPPLSAIEDDLERVFIIKRSIPSPSAAWDPSLPDFALVKSEFDSSLMVAEGHWVQPTDVLALWRQKSRLDPLFSKENRHSGAYTSARNALFMGDVSGSRNFRNRAGDKLYEVLQQSGIMNALYCSRQLLLFADVCGGPGAFSEVLFKICNKAADHIVGVGLTLEESDGGTANWYPQLTNDRRFKAIYGPDGKGDAYNPATIADVEREVRKHDERGAYLVMADGGFNVTSDDLSIENIQEIYTARLLLAELLSAISSLRKGGHFVCKLFDTFSDFLASFLYICVMVFDDVKVVKPARSRTVNSERYLAASGFRDVACRGGTRYWIVEHIRALHTKCFAQENPTPPHSLVPVSLMLKDEAFVRSMRHLNTTLAHRQTEALIYVLGEVDWSLVRPVAPNPDPKGPRFIVPPWLEKLEGKKDDHKEDEEKDTKADEETKEQGHDEKGEDAASDKDKASTATVEDTSKDESSALSTDESKTSPS